MCWFTLIYRSFLLSHPSSFYPTPLPACIELKKTSCVNPPERNRRAKTRAGTESSNHSAIQNTWTYFLLRLQVIDLLFLFRFGFLYKGLKGEYFFLCKKIHWLF